MVNSSRLLGMLMLHVCLVLKLTNFTCDRIN